MKAAIYQGNKTFVTGESEPKTPGKGEVKLKVSFCGVCGTDVHIYHGAMDKRVSIPQVIGHEVSAEVAEVGEGVEGIKPGDRVAVRPLDPKEPDPSDHGFTHIGKNQDFIGIDTPGGMQSFWTVPAHTLHKLPDSVSQEHGAMIEPLAVACHDVRLSGLQKGENCVVIGGGPIGMLIALVAKEKGANVIISEVNPHRLSLASSLGMEVVNPTEEDIVDKVDKITKGAFADVVYEVSGSQEGVNIMTELPRARGRIVMVAVHPNPKPVNLFRFFWRELQMIGVRVYEREDFDEAIKLAGSGNLPLDRLITEIAPVESVQKVFEQIDSNPEGMKYLIRCNE